MCRILFYFQDCSKCQNEPGQELKDAIQELESLSLVMCGGSQNPSFKKLSSLRRLDLLRCESEELLSKSTMGKNLFTATCRNSIMQPFTTPAFHPIS